ncbi:MAG: PKD domain-containing protein, partial [Bacteroidales bacterium]|nr:PKD domain-containing protein [Bacteroidales bacterium]
PKAVFVIEQLGRTVTLTNGSINATSYEWELGDGETSTEFDVVYTYAENGEFTIVLTAVGPGGSDSYSDTAVVAVSNFVGSWKIDSMRWQGGFTDYPPYDIMYKDDVPAHWGSQVFLAVPDTMITSGIVTFNLDGTIKYNGTATSASAWTEVGNDIAMSKHGLPSGTFSGTLNASKNKFTLACGPFGTMNQMPPHYSAVWGVYAPYLNNTALTFYGSLVP